MPTFNDACSGTPGCMRAEIMWLLMFRAVGWVLDSGPFDFTTWLFAACLTFSRSFWLSMEELGTLVGCRPSLLRLLCRILRWFEKSLETGWFAEGDCEMC